MMLWIGVALFLVGAFAFATSLELLLQRRYGRRDYRPELQHLARLLSITRWILLALAVVGVWLLLSDGQPTAGIALVIGWIGVSLVLRITAGTLRKWGTEP